MARPAFAAGLNARVRHDDRAPTRRRVGWGWRSAGADPERPEVWVGAFLPWPAVVADPSNRLSGVVAGNIAPPSRALDRDNRLRPQNLAHGVVRRSEARARAVDRPSWLQAADVRLARPGRPGATFTLGGLFAALRRNGITPHGEGADRDGYVAARLLNRIGALRPRAAAAAPEESVATDDRLCTADGDWPRMSAATDAGRAAADFQASVAGRVGDAGQMAGDAARMGLGRARHLKQCDINWASLFPVNELVGDFYDYGEEVPRPDTLLANLRVAPDTGEAFGRFAPITELLCTLWGLGLKADLTPFNTGGGSAMNDTGGGEGRADDDPIVYFEDPFGGKAVYTTGDLWGDIREGRPAWQAQGMLIPSGLGWASFYWDFPTFPKDSPAEVTYQRYAVNVWPDRSEPAALVTTSKYAQEACRRKGLAIAAFATGVAEWLTGVDASLREACDKTASVYDVVDTIELGNELDGFWDTSTPSGASVYEVGRYMALIAGPIKAALPDMRFRTELHAWARYDEAKTAPFTNAQEKLGWLRGVLQLGMFREVQRWTDQQLYQARRARSQLLMVLRGDWKDGWPGIRTEMEAWLASCASARFQWPPAIFDVTALYHVTERVALMAEINAAMEAHVPVRVSDLIHEVGWHWYHYQDHSRTGDASPPQYADPNRLGDDMAELTGEFARLTGLTLSATVGEIGFPAYDPGAPPGDFWDAGYFAGASPTYQAAMLLQLVASALAGGASVAGLFTFNFGSVPSVTGWADGYTFTSWGNFYTTGYHNDVEPSGETYSQAQHCWPRPAWFAIRRLAWLLGQNASITRCHAARGATVLQLTFASGLTTLPDGTAASRTWTNAFLVWLDSYADSSDVHPPADLGASSMVLAFADPTDEGYELVSVVPEVTPQTSPEDTTAFPARWRVDAYGYSATSARAGENPNWEWTGWNAALTEATVGGGVMLITVAKADPTAGTVLAPLCVLTNATFDSVTM